MKNYEKHFREGLVMSKGNEKHFRKANKCQICNKLYSEQDIRIRDHCNITGEYKWFGSLNL